MPNPKFALTPKELRKVERDHVAMMEQTDGEPMRMALQVGSTRVFNGKQYVLNENHRWTRHAPTSSGGNVKSSPSLEEHYRGLANWVDQYKQTRNYGNLELAKKIKGKINNTIKTNNLDADRVWGRKPKDAGKPKPKLSRPLAPHYVDVDADPNNDGITDAARVGVNAWHVPPPPKIIPRIEGLNPIQKQAEEKFCRRFERNPERMTRAALAMFKKSTKPGEPISFETDLAKQLSPEWNSRRLKANLAQRAVNRGHFNVALHQVANSVTKRAFLQHLDTLQPGSHILVTCGGCGAGKGYALKNVPEALALKKSADVIWDSAGDQNATENPWILAEAEKRGLKVSYMYVHADPHSSWANPDFGVVKRAQDPNDGRMVDAKVFADSYAIGAKNHYAFASAQKDNPNCNFIYLSNGQPPNLLDGMPKAALEIDRNELNNFAAKAVEALGENIPPHVKFGALNGQTLWKD